MNKETKVEDMQLSPADGKPPISGSNCSQCVFFRYEASWGHGWCYNDNSQYSGKLRGNGPSCHLNTSKLRLVSRKLKLKTNKTF